MTAHTCCFTGHRSKKLPWANEEDPAFQRFRTRMEGEIRRLVSEYGARHFITGMAEGVDLFAAELVLRLRGELPELTLECAIPYQGHSRNGNTRYQQILQQADRQTVLQPSYSYDCFKKRNCYMVDKSSFVLAVWSGSGGGTAHTVQYALEQGREVILLNPNGFLFL